jgi:hypothetical protein
MFDNNVFKSKLFPMGSPLITHEQLMYAIDNIIKTQQPNVTDSKGRTLLHSAVLPNDKDVVVKLMGLGCDMNLYDKFGYRPYDYAFDNCCWNVIEYMLQQQYEAKCNNYVACSDNFKPFHSDIHQLCAYDHGIWGDKLMNTLKVLINLDPKCLFRTDPVYNGTPLYWADRANKHIEPNALMVYLEEEMVNKLISGAYVEEPIIPKLFMDETAKKEHNNNNNNNSITEIVTVVDNYKLSTNIKNLIDEDNEKEKESLRDQIINLTNGLKDTENDLMICKQDLLFAQEESRLSKQNLDKTKEQLEQNKVNVNNTIMCVQSFLDSLKQ